MKYDYSGKYFDGTSSKHFIVDIIFKNYSDELTIVYSENILLDWKLNDLKFELNNNFIEIREKSNLFAVLTVENNTFIREFINRMKEKKNINIHQKLMLFNIKKLLIISFFIIISLVFFYIFISPIIVEKAIEKLPKSIDNQIGDKVYESIIDNKDIDYVKSDLLNDFSKQLIIENKESIHFIVINSEIINAFALPNGQIIVYSGLIDKMNTYKELVALMGHEITHVNKRHSIKLLANSIRNSFFWNIFTGNNNNFSIKIIENSENLYSLSHDRNFEKEADEYGFYFMKKNNIDPNGFVDLLENFYDESDNKLMEFISTHPITKNRIDNVKNLISENNYKILENNKLNLLFNKIKNQ